MSSVVVANAFEFIVGLGCRCSRIVEGDLRGGYIGVDDADRGFFGRKACCEFGVLCPQRQAAFDDRNVSDFGKRRFKAHDLGGGSLQRGLGRSQLGYWIASVRQRHDERRRKLHPRQRGDRLLDSRCRSGQRVQ